MLHVTVRIPEVSEISLASGERLIFGRAPQAVLPSAPEAARPENRHMTTVAIPHSSRHTSRILGEIVVGDEVPVLNWRGTTEAQLSSLFHAPGGSRRVALMQGMDAHLDDGDNDLVVLRGYQRDDLVHDLLIKVFVESPGALQTAPQQLEPDLSRADLTVPAPRLERQSREWYVALALAEPWLSNAPYPRSPSNREIYERIMQWHGYAWNLDKVQRVDDAIRAVARVAFGPLEDPFARTSGRTNNARFAIGQRAAEVRLVTPEDLAAADAGRRK